MSACRDFQEHLIKAFGREHAPLAVFMLNHGRQFKIIPETFTGRRMKPKLCFENALKLVHRKPWLTYCEGYVHALIPLHHAWAATPKGEVIDPTLSLTGLDGKERKIDDYFGIPFKWEFVCEGMLATKTAGLLDGMSRFSGELITGKVPPERFLDDLP